MSNATILIVEDDAILSMHLLNLINRLGYTAMGPFSSGEKLLAFLSENRVDLVLMDIQLSGEMDGITTASWIQSTVDIPIVFLTSYSLDPLPQRAKTTMPYGYLIKPVSERELAVTLEMAFHRHMLDCKHKETHIALAKSEANYRHLFNNTPIGIFRTTLDGKVLMVNNEMARRCGCTTPEEVLRECTDLVQQFYVDPEKRQELLTLLQEKGGVNLFEVEGRKKNGETVWFSLNAKLTTADESNGQVGGQVIDGFAIDITESKRAEKERRNLQAQLQQAQKMEAIGTLAGGIAHDFNNILGAILGYAEMAQEDCPAGSMIATDIKQILMSGYRARELVKQILAFSRQAETRPIPVQPANIIREAGKMLRSSLPSTIAIQMDVDTDLQRILADPTQIHQVVMNLCTNAFHAMEEKGGTLTISLKNKTLTDNDLTSEPQMQPGQFVQLSIADTGPGIAPEILDKIFDPYFTTKEVGKGTGMGLAIVHGIVKSYGGSIACNSKPGEGTVFDVVLPVIIDTALLDAQASELIQLGNERLLFIDDEEILAEMGKNMLERLGYRVTVRTSSLEALTTFQNQPDQFDLVITDQTMPGITGSDLARRMLQIRPGVPVILCTGYSNLISAEKARSLGIKGFAMKPLAKKDIAALIRKALDGERCPA